MLPPDRGHIDTEQRHPASAGLDELPVIDIVRLMVDDHRAMAEAVDRASSALAVFISDLAHRVRQGGRLIYVGAGTSGRLGVLDASECPPTFQSDPGLVVGLIAGGDAALRRSSEGMEDDPRGAEPELERLVLNTTDTLLGIAAGGTTPYVLGALAYGARAGAMTGLLTCSRREAPPHCDHLVVLETGPEILTGSTRLKAGSATKLALNIITTALFVQLGKVHDNLMVDLRATNAKLIDRAIRTLCLLDPSLSRMDAKGLLGAAGGAVKVAAIMSRHGLDRAAAEARLQGAGGVLRAALET